MDLPPNAAGVFNKYASQYQQRFMDVSRYSESFDLFCSLLSCPNASILELGCGPGNITRYLLNKQPCLNILATDLAPNMLELAKQNNPTASFKIMDARHIAQLTNRYNGILCGFCLPYLSLQETLKLIQDSNNLLHTGGLLYLSTMEDDYGKSGLRKSSQGDEIYMHYYPADTLTKILKQHQFEMLYERHFKYTEQDGTETTDLVIIARK